FGCSSSGVTSSHFPAFPILSSSSSSWLNYGGVYVGLPSEAVSMVSNQTKTVRKSKIALCLFSKNIFML
uniref:Uncharacterized protein n=1 Tax=Spermophilus dauricus TaxID=99837 RepID=A0A8C9UUW2_SPEDA